MVEALTNAINKFFNNSNLRKKYKENGKIRIEKEFTKKIMIKKVFNIYKEFIYNLKM